MDSVSPRSRGTKKPACGYVSETDFPDLAAEAETLQELVRKIRQLVPYLCDANRHLMHPRWEW